MTKLYLLTLQGPHSFFFSWRSNSVGFKQSLFCSIKIFLNIEIQMLFKCIIISFLSLETVQVLNATETGGESIRDECKRKWHDDKGQKCLASNGKPCHFPYKFREKVMMQLQFILLFNQFSGFYILQNWLQGSLVQHKRCKLSVKKS